MAVTTTLDLHPTLGLDLASTSQVMDVTGLAGGGLAGLGDNAGHVDATFFDASLAPAGTSQDIDGTNGSIDQLNNGNVVMATQVNALGYSFRIVTATGATVLDDFPVAVVKPTNLDVSALSDGGFVIVAQQDFNGGNQDIFLHRYAANGSLLSSFTVDASADLDQAPAVAGLVGGGMVVTWTRDLGGGVTRVGHAVYNADASPRAAPAYLAAYGDVNGAVAVVALDSGGYAIAYQDSGWEVTGDLEITLARHDSTGSFIGETRVTVDARNDTDPALTVLSNGLIAVTWTRDDAGDQNVLAQLVDPDTGSLLLSEPKVVAASAGDELDSAAAEWGLAGLAVSLQGHATDVATYQLTRTSTGDGGANIITGDEAIDTMFGAAGADSLSGLDNSDHLYGEAGSDTLNGGAGGDELDGGDNGDSVVGGAGGDLLSGGAGADTILGGAGEDVAYADFGADALAGGLDSDTLRFDHLSGATFVDLAFAGPQNTHSAGSDSITGFENAWTGEGDDRVKGSGERNFITTGGGADTLKGGKGGDDLRGGEGADTLMGGASDDALRGQGGRDILTGGAGRDGFRFDALSDSAVGVALCDVIRDFSTEEADVIDLSAIGLEEVAYIGGAGFSGAAPEVRVGAVAQGQLVQVDADGDGLSDMDVLVLNDGLQGGADDFVF